MTNFFGINITDNKRNTDIDGNIFVVGTITAEQDNEISQFIETEEGFEKKQNLPLSFEIIRSVCQLVWMIILIATVKVLGSGMSFAQGYNNAPILRTCLHKEKVV